MIGDTEDVDALLTGQQVAELLQIPESSVRHWREKGTGPVFMRVGKHVRYRRQDVQAWLAAQIQGGPR